MPDSRVPNYLRAWREHRRLTQDALAEMVGASKATIGHLESGERRLSDKWLQRLAPALGTTMGRLLEHHPDEIDDRNDAFVTASPVAGEPTPADRVIRIMRSVSADRQEAIATTVEALIGRYK